MRTICVIPARGGSKRIPGKNMRPFLGVPIIKRVWNTAIMSELFDDIIVSSEDARILSYAVGQGIHVLRRPPQLALDHVGLEPVLADVLSRVRADVVCLMLATAVLVDENNLINGREFLSTKHNIVSVRESDKDDAGQFYWMYAKTFLREWELKHEIWSHDPNVVIQPHLKYVIPDAKCEDINTEEDWTRAEEKWNRLNGR